MDTYHTSITMTSLVAATLVVVHTLAPLAGQERVADVACWAGTHWPVVAVGVETWSTVSLGATRVRTAQVSCNSTCCSYIYMT